MKWKQKKKNIRLYDGFLGQKEVTQTKKVIEWCIVENGPMLLDIACGTGDPARGIAEQYPNVEVVGIDLTKARVKQGHNWAREDGLVNTHFVVGDVDTLPFKADLFDTVTCVGAFQHFPDPLNVLCEASRVLKLKGRLILSTVLVPEDQEGYNFINKLSRIGVYPGACLGYPSKSELERLLKACGLRYELIGKNEKATALSGKEVIAAARSAPPRLKERFGVEVRGEKVFFNWPKPIVTAIGEKEKQESVEKNIPKPIYLTEASL